VTQATRGADVVDELTTDHREATELLDRILTTSDPQTRRDMADTVITELVRHSVAEEMYVYPVIRRPSPTARRSWSTTSRSTRSSSAR
jgi:hemerythrin superfamily protein